MTWRERIQAARERGAFTQQDWLDSWDIHVCACGVWRDVLRDAGVEFMAIHEAFYSHEDNSGLGQRFPLAVTYNRFAEAEAIVDAIEDRAMQLKREAHADGPER